uniref:14-3-3 domain-containing protein n=1 Tax=Arcella intermedia TaxID=1963864 RepID=A0A6B2LFP9_9EUKA
MGLLAEEAERMDLVVYFVSEICHLHVPLLPDEQKLLCAAFKHTISPLRYSIRAISPETVPVGEHQDRGLSISQQDNIRRRWSDALKEELQGVLREFVGIIDEHLLPFDGRLESRVLYYRLKGDYARLSADLLPRSSPLFASSSTSALENYLLAMDLSESFPERYHPVHLTVILNLSVFYYDIQNDVKQAIELARSGYDSFVSSPNVEFWDHDFFSDVSLVYGLIRDNLSLWNNE